MQKCFSRFFKKREQEQFTDSALASNKPKRDFVKLQQDFTNILYFFHSANLLTLHSEHKQLFSVIIYRRLKNISQAVQPAINKKMRKNYGNLLEKNEKNALQ